MRSVWVILALVGTAACGEAPAVPAAHHHAEENAPEVYHGRGTILWFEDGQVYLNHEEIPGFMDAMAMGYAYEDPSIVEGLSPGMAVRFRVVVEGDHFHIDQIAPE